LLACARTQQSHLQVALCAHFTALRAISSADTNP
jgi:hypothetical protein